MQATESRVHRLERQFAAWRAIGSVAVVFVIAAFAIGQARPKQNLIENQRIVFRDASGKVRMELAGEPQKGEVLEWYGLMFYDEDGGESARVRMAGDTLEIQMKGSRTDAIRIVESVDKKSKLTGENRAVMMAAAERRGQGISVLNSEGLTVISGEGDGVRAGASVRADHVTLSDRGGKIAAVLGSWQTEHEKTGARVTHPAASMLLFNGDGKVIYRAP